MILIQGNTVPLLQNQISVEKEKPFIMTRQGRISSSGGRGGERGPELVTRRPLGGLQPGWGQTLSERRVPRE